MEHKNILILIPSRYHSSRFEGKPLALINGKSLVQRVYEGCESSKTQDSKNFKLTVKTCVVTDDDRIEKHVNGFGGMVVRVDEDVISGTLRIEKAFSKYFTEEKNKFDVIINVQGDEPLIEGTDIIELAEFHLSKGYSISTIVKTEPLSNTKIKKSDNVKAIYSRSNGKCFFFTRGQVPFDRDENQNGEWFLHIGVYAYSPESLREYCKLGPSYYENIEKLEQLRAIENDLTIGAIEIDHQMIGVDRPEDIDTLEEILNGN